MLSMRSRAEIWGFDKTWEVHFGKTVRVERRRTLSHRQPRRSWSLEGGLPDPNGKESSPGPSMFNEERPRQRADARGHMSRHVTRHWRPTTVQAPSP